MSETEVHATYTAMKTERLLLDVRLQELLESKSRGFLISMLAGILGKEPPEVTIDLILQQLSNTDKAMLVEGLKR